jgi:excisionase family DNA binding protein
MPSNKKVRSVTSEASPLYLIDIPEASRRLSTTVFAIRELIRSNKLKFIFVGHKQLISPQAIQDFIRASERYYDAA